ncbi:MAG TPA: acetate uptake transporter [Syntrophomonadaceae bacterium]|nr:acetate uptake transporter [Syntrophomonadaceae bacterium]
MSDNNNVKAEVSLGAATADPGPLGLGGFALTTFVLSIANAKIIEGHAFLGLAFFYGGLAQLLAGMQEFKKNNVFGATAFSTYGAFWMSLALMTLLVACGVPVKWGGPLTGIFLVAFTIFNTYMWIGSFRVNVAVCAVFTTLEITFILLDLAEFGITSSVPGGIMGIICALSAWYASAAGVLNTVFRKTVLPVGPLNK